MDEFDIRIIAEMKTRPGEAYINPEGTKLYLLTEQDKLVCLPGSALHSMTDAELNIFVQQSLLKLMKE